MCHMAKIEFYYLDLTEFMDILYANLHIDCFGLFRAVDIEKPVIMVGIAMDTPPEHDPLFVETKNIDDNNRYLVDVAKKLFDYIYRNEDEIEEGVDEAEVDIDPEVVNRIKSVEVYNISEYDYALLFIFNLR